jgi:hypothetical protein
VCTIAASAALAWLPAVVASAAPAQPAASRPAVSRAVPSAAAAVRTLGQEGMITGSVLGPAGIPLAGICVTASGPDGRHEVRTGTTGRYAFTGLTSGSFRIGYLDCAGPDGYAAQGYPGGQVQVVAGRPAQLAPVALTPATPAQAIAAEQAYAHAHPAIAAAAGARPVITGRVTNSAGKPLAGICVLATLRTKLSSGVGTLNLSLIFVSSTRRSGSYSVPKFPGATATSWRVLFTAGCGNSGNYAPQWWHDAASRTKETLLVPAKGTTTFSGISARLVRGASLTGTVRGGSASGAGLSGACVRAAGQGGQEGVSITGRTGAGGRYVLHGLGTGDYSIRFTACSAGNFLTASGGTMAVRDGRTGTDSGFLRPGATITGTVTSSPPGSAGISGICVDLQDGDGNEWGATTGDSGTYSIGRLAAGSYQLSFSGGCGNTGSYAPQFYSSASTTGTVSAAAASPVSVPAGGSATASTAMLPGGTVTGTVTSQSTGRALADACVTLAGPGPAAVTGPDQFSGDGPDEAFTSQSGRYEADNLAPGLYLAAGSSCGDPAYASAWFETSGPQPDWISVSAGTPTSGINVALPRAGSVSGTVTNTAGRKLAGICTLAESADEGLEVLGDAVADSEPVGVTGASGTYRIEDLTPGAYTVDFGSCTTLGTAKDSYAPRLYRAAGPGHSAVVTVRAGRDTGGIGGAVGAGWTLRGKVVAASTGKPLRHVCVLHWFGGSSAALLLGAGLTYSGASGQFTVPHIAAGTYQVALGPCGSAGASLAPIELSMHVTAANHGSVFVFRLPRAGTIAGNVTAAGQPGGAAQACVEVSPVGSVAGGDPIEDDDTFVAADGSYTIGGLAPGSYQLVIDDSCSGSTALAAQTFSPVRVTAAHTTVQDADLVANGSISGTVTSATPSGPLAGICVAAFASAAAASPAAVATTGADGSYQLGFLPPGGYVIEFSSGCGATGYTAQWYDGQSSAATAGTVTVTAGTDQGDVGATMSN